MQTRRQFCEEPGVALCVKIFYGVVAILVALILAGRLFVSVYPEACDGLTGKVANICLGR